ncbi:hypothetical protein [Paraburkholderia sp. SIMBA_054]|uniref:hypothetical protein n=1 Tax=Paraburkholderia sp. SIMBA_054 TaxID=3085795 RepID=UPI003978F072
MNQQAINARNVPQARSTRYFVSYQTKSNEVCDVTIEADSERASREAVLARADCKAIFSSGEVVAKMPSLRVNRETGYVEAVGTRRLVACFRSDRGEKELEGFNLGFFEPSLHAGMDEKLRKIAADTGYRYRRDDRKQAPIPSELAVETLRVGDRVDLKSCPFLKGHSSADFEYAVVESVERETPDCVAVGYEDIDVVGYPVGTRLTVSPETFASRRPHLCEFCEQAAVAVLPQSTDQGATVRMVRCCANHRAVWWDGADWDGRHLEVDMPTQELPVV